jgi:hypothetical protein
MGRRSIRIGLLLVALAGCVTYLLADPVEPVDIEAHWLRLTPAPATCTVETDTKTDWSIRVAGSDDFGDMISHVRANIDDACDGPECAAHGRAEVAPTWGERPGFFSGFGSALVDVDVAWRRPGCEGNARWRLALTVDQGRRGREAVMKRHMARVVADFLSGNTWAL